MDWLLPNIAAAEEGPTIDSGLGERDDSTGTAAEGVSVVSAIGVLIARLSTAVTALGGS